MNLFFRVSGVVLILLVFLGCGVVIGEHRVAPTVVIERVTEQVSPNVDSDAVVLSKDVPKKFNLKDTKPIQ